jgi:hypothetical protein
MGRISRKGRDPNWQKRPKKGHLPIGARWIHGGPDGLKHPRWTR